MYFLWLPVPIDNLQNKWFLTLSPKDHSRTWIHLDPFSFRPPGSGQEKVVRNYYQNQLNNKLTTNKTTMCASKRVQIICQCEEDRYVVYSVISTKPNPFLGTHCILQFQKQFKLYCNREQRVNYIIVSETIQAFKGNLPREQK